MTEIKESNDSAGAMARRLYETTDAQVWAREFMAVVQKGPSIQLGLIVDESFMIGWFANAIENAKLHTQREIRKAQNLAERGDEFDNGSTGGVFAAIGEQITIDTLKQATIDAPIIADNTSSVLAEYHVEFRYEQKRSDFRLIHKPSNRQTKWVRWPEIACLDDVAVASPFTVEDSEAFQIMHAADLLKRISVGEEK